MMNLRTVSFVAVVWILVGALLLALNASCSGVRCSEGQWFATIFLLIVWGCAGVGVVSWLLVAVISNALSRMR